MKRRYLFLMTAILIMKKGNNFLILLMLFVVILSGCKKAGELPANAADSISAQVDAIKASAENAVVGALPNETQQDSAASTQTMYLPQDAAAQDSNIILQSYTIPCRLQRFTFLNKYCGFKNYWSKQSTLLSWYLPYWIVLLFLFIAIVIFLWNLWKGRN